mmetsp:Transcript_17946/g.42593  ORF Transcript_17946/g.42593 Transcript_17946/m.42593 type:complete len:201 (+) Transcript_17946:368-970(+)
MDLLRQRRHGAHKVEVVAAECGAVLHAHREERGEGGAHTCLLEDLACRGLAHLLAEVHQAAGQLPAGLAQAVLLAHTEHLALRVDDQAAAAYDVRGEVGHGARRISGQPAQKHRGAAFSVVKGEAMARGNRSGRRVLDGHTHPHTAPPRLTQLVERQHQLGLERIVHRLLYGDGGALEACGLPRQCRRAGAEHPPSQGRR